MNFIEGVADLKVLCGVGSSLPPPPSSSHSGQDFSFCVSVTN